MHLQKYPEICSPLPLPLCGNFVKCLISKTQKGNGKRWEEMAENYNNTRKEEEKGIEEGRGILFSAPPPPPPGI